jgi:hypothetical protein
MEDASGFSKRMGGMAFYFVLGLCLPSLYFPGKGFHLRYALLLFVFALNMFEMNQSPIAI